MLSQMIINNRWRKGYKMTEGNSIKKRGVTRDSSYDRKQIVRDREYRDGYREWLDSLSPEERAKAKDLGVAEAAIDRKAVGRGFNGVELDRIGDRSEGLAASMPEVEYDEVKQEAMRLVRVVLANIFNPAAGRTVAYEVDIIGIALGVPGMGSVTAVAAKHGFTKAAISKAAVKFTDDNGLPPSVYMRSEANREVHRQANRRRRKAS